VDPDIFFFIEFCAEQCTVARFEACIMDCNILDQVLPELQLLRSC
jgi:hypothetical protein